MKILHRIKELRIETQSTQQELAQLLNVSQNTYSQYESGKRQIPIDILIQLAMHYEVSTDYILDITDIDTPYPLKDDSRFK
ncbi:MAG: helix-turn-helix transcriptional regulator [Clostridiales bacterium]|nr:helix-turn-helix transcriptional regulator [Clostridiales bacterium]